MIVFQRDPLVADHFPALSCSGEHIDAIDTLKEYDAIYLGAVGDPGVPDHISLLDLLLKIRHEFDQYVNVRPVKLLKGTDCVGGVRYLIHSTSIFMSLSRGWVLVA